MTKKYSSNKRVGLALGGGGPRGLAHIGVIKALKENKIPIDAIAGSSAGALIGGLYLSLGSIERVEEVAKNVNYLDIFSIFSKKAISSGILSGEKMEKYLNEILKGRKIETLRKPFAAIATEITTGKVINITKGNLARSIRASSSIPALINAVEINNHLLVDGGNSCPVPVKPVKDLGVDVVIAVNLDSFKLIEPESLIENISAKDIGVASFNILRSTLAKELCKQADITITPDVVNIPSFNLISFVNGKGIIQKGYEAAMKSISKIKKCLSHK